MSSTRLTEDDEPPKLESIVKALKCEQSGHIMESILLYEESIFKLRNMAAVDASKKQLCGKYLKMYEGRANQLREQVKTHLHKSKLLDHISIERESRGRSYQRLFGQYLDDNVKEAHLNEPYLTDHHHFKNLLSFFEVLVKNCRFLKYIRITTRPDASTPKNQLHILQQIRSDLATGNIQMNFQLDDSLHDRKIVLSSGIVIKIGRGLHYFEPKRDVYNLGLCDFDFRKCLPTEVDIWKCKPFAKKPKEKFDSEEYNETKSKETNETCTPDEDLARAYSTFPFSKAAGHFTCGHIRAMRQICGNRQVGFNFGWNIVASCQSLWHNNW